MKRSLSSIILFTVTFICVCVCVCVCTLLSAVSVWIRWIIAWLCVCDVLGRGCRCSFLRRCCMYNLVVWVNNKHTSYIYAVDTWLWEVREGHTQDVFIISNANNKWWDRATCEESNWPTVYVLVLLISRKIPISPAISILAKKKKRNEWVLDAALWSNQLYACGVILVQGYIGTSATESYACA